MKKNTLKEDLKAPLDRVQRAWIRKPVIIILILPLLLLGVILAIAGLMIGLKNFIVDCWRGPQCDHANKEEVAFHPQEGYMSYHCPDCYKFWKEYV